MTHSVRYSILLILTLVLGFAACKDDPVDNGDLQYTVTILPSLGGTSGGGSGISNSGLVVGASNLSGDDIERAALWQDGSETDLGALGGSGTSSSVVWPGVNNAGMIAGISETSEPDPFEEDWSCSAFIPSSASNTCRGFVWESGEMTSMPTLGGNNSFATGINNEDQVVGWAETSVQDPTCSGSQVLQFRAVLWEPKEDQIQELPPLPGDSTSAATAINDKGHVVGISGGCGVAVGGPSAAHAVLWEDGVPTEIGDLGGVNWHTPMALNEQGIVVGFSNPPGDGSGAFNVQPFIWTAEDGADPLGMLPGHTNGQALGINESGQIVGVSDGPGERLAVIWQDGEITDLNTLAEFESDFSGYLRVAGHINDAGVITGVAVDTLSGESMAYIATPAGDNP